MHMYFCRGVISGTANLKEYLKISVTTTNLKISRIPVIILHEILFGMQSFLLHFNLFTFKQHTVARQEACKVLFFAEN